MKNERYLKANKPRLSDAQTKARLEICWRVANSGGDLSDAAATMGTLSRSGLYYWLRSYAPEELFRALCPNRRIEGSRRSWAINDKHSARRVELIEEYGYAGAARKLGLNPRRGGSALQNWLKYRVKNGLFPGTPK